MSTSRQIAANRNNARSSTGPRTQRGRARASRNARRHGLSVSVVSDPRLSEHVENLARDIVGETASPAVLEMARRFAEAQIDLDRIRKARGGCCGVRARASSRTRAGAIVCRRAPRHAAG
jgi:hypothetical protein